jgi:hypothetical protein
MDPIEQKTTEEVKDEKIFRDPTTGEVISKA